MTIGTYSVYVNNGLPGWNKTNVIEGLEDAFSWAELHGEPLTGLVQNVASYSGGGTYNGGDTTWYDRTQNTTSGIGTGASFRVIRSGATDTVTSVVVNRPGRNYSNGETVIISSENIGGAVNGASNLSVTIATVRDGFNNPVSFGTTDTFFDKDFTNTSAPWGVLRTVQDNNKAYGETYWYFRVPDTSSLQIGSSAKYHPYHRRWAGEPGFDGRWNDPLSGGNEVVTSGNLKSATITYSNGDQSYPLQLNCFRSGLDPDFCIFSFKQPTLASSTLANQTYTTFFLHNYTSSFFDLEKLWQGAFTLVFRNNSMTGAYGELVYTNGNTVSPALKFGVYTGVNNTSDNFISYARRSTEAGYWRSGHLRPWTWYPSNVYPGRAGYSGGSAYDSDHSFYGNHPSSTLSQRIYYRSSAFDGTAESLNFNAVIKGLPVCAAYAPCPYYLPDDIVLIDFYYPQSNAFIAQFDTVTISPTEVYTVIDASYNLSGSTRGILLCGRIV